MTWTAALRAVLSLPLLAAIYLLSLVLIDSLRGPDSTHNPFIEAQADAVARFLTTSYGLLIIIVGLLLWSTLIWLTNRMAERSRCRLTEKRMLAERAKICAENILRYSVMRRQRDSFAIKLAGITEEDLSMFSATESLAGEFEILWSSQVLAIFNQGEAYGIRLTKEEASLVEHPKAPREVEAVARKLTSLSKVLEGLIDRVEAEELDRHEA